MIVVVSTTFASKHAVSRPSASGLSANAASPPPLFGAHSKRTRPWARRSCLRIRATQPGGEQPGGAKFLGRLTRPEEALREPIPLEQLTAGQVVQLQGFARDSEDVELNGALCKVVGTKKPLFRNPCVQVAFVAGLGKALDLSYYKDPINVRPDRCVMPTNQSAVPAAQTQPPQKNKAAAGSGGEDGDAAGVMSKLYEGSLSRLYGMSLDSGYEPGTLDAVKEGKCPRCGVTVTEDMPSHKNNWCDKCQQSDSLWDFSKGF